MKPWLAALLLAAFSASCSDPVAPASPTPVDATVTEQFGGTLAVKGSNVHSFNVSQVGRLKVTLTSVTPNASVVLAVGTPTGVACVPTTPAIAVQAGPVPQFSGTATITGTFCISVSDTDTLTEPVNYSVTVVHS